MCAALKERWHTVCDKTIGTETFWRLAVDHRAARQALAPLIERHARGVVLDLGAGRLAWSALLSRRARRYVAADFSSTHPDLDLRFDVQHPFPFADASVDTIFCCSVLEHVPAPWLVLRECYRVLTPGGMLLLSVPFLYHLHGAPEDYYRFSPFGVRHLAESAGFEIVAFSTAGGLCHSVLHAASMATTSVLYSERWPQAAAAVARVLAAVAGAVDSLDRQHLFAQNVVAALRRP